ncbi:hypothetical protein ACFL2T_07270 [Elusimicrobiota bacterium]
MTRFWYFTKKKLEFGLATLSKSPVNIFPWDMPFNDWDPMGLSPQKHPGMIAGLLGHAGNFLEGAEGVLGDAAYRLYEARGVFDGSDSFPVWSDLLRCLESYKGRDPRYLIYLTTLRTRIRSLIRTMGSAVEFRRGLDLRLTHNTNTIFHLSLQAPPLREVV